MSSLAHLCAGGLAVVFLMDYVVVPAATGPGPVQQSFHAQASRVQHVVDRSRKGDRIMSTQGSNSNAQPAPVEQTRPQPTRIPVGCDPAFSPLSGSSRANFAGRCLVDNLPAPRVFAALG